MDLVIDANILFSALIKDSITAELLLDKNIRLFSPEFLLEELSKHQQTILDKTKRTAADLSEILLILEDIITITPKEEYENHIEEAERISPDIDDAEYFALALKLNCGMWTNELRLKKQNKIPIYSTADLVKLLLK